MFGFRPSIRSSYEPIHGEERNMKKTVRNISLYPMFLLTAIVAFDNHAHAQTTMLPSIEETLKAPGQVPAVTQSQLQTYMMNRLPPLPSSGTPQHWTSEEERLRKHLLDNVVYHGWSRDWIDAAPHFEQTGVIETQHGYRIRKLRYEIVPGFWSTALLYEPTVITAPVPAILNFIGHEPEGIEVEYEQKRCINFAKRGMIALSLGWMSFGELSQPDNDHDYAAHLSLAGANALGLFYLSMRRGLDYVAALPQVDPKRIGATGLSGGGWQTVILAALDPRIAVSVEVAGLGSRESNLTNPRDLYEVEEAAPDLIDGFDYPELIAMRAPRPTLLVHNAVDSCCFRAPLVKPYLFDNVKPFFELYGKPDNLGWHENFIPGVHNYQRDNRIQAYRFFTSEFGLPVVEGEIFSDNEIRSSRELAIPLPAGNLTILALARKIAGTTVRDDTQSRDANQLATEREKLKSTVRYTAVQAAHALRYTNSKGMDFMEISYDFVFSNGLSADAMAFKQDDSPVDQPVTIVLNDQGYKEAGKEVYEALTSGHEVLALDPLFIGSSMPETPDSSDWELLVDSSGDRSLGLQVAQLLAVTHWLRSTHPQTRIQISTRGIRTQVVALIAAAIEPNTFADETNQGGMMSLSYLYDKPVPPRAAPELFCLDLYRQFDIDFLSSLASPTQVIIARQ
jgi:dienelactone hydrolase